MSTQMKMALFMIVAVILAIAGLIWHGNREADRFLNDWMSAGSVAVVDDSNTVEIVVAELHVPARGTQSCSIDSRTEARIGCRCIDPGVPRTEIDPHKMAYSFKETQRGYSFSASLTSGLAQRMTPRGGRFAFLAENFTDHDIVLQVYRQEKKD